LGGYGKKAFHKPPQALARERWQQLVPMHRPKIG